MLPFVTTSSGKSAGVPNQDEKSSQRIEPALMDQFKRDLSSPEGILKCLVAFADTAGGTVVIGVEDGSKNVRGVPDVLLSEEKLANLVSDWIRPRLIPDIEVVPWRNLNVLAVHVYPSNTRPH